MKNVCETKPLRTGFTTGACAAAAAVAAWRAWQGAPKRSEAELLFPDGKLRAVGIAGAFRGREQAEAWVVKDAGDDVDITDGAVIRVCLKREFLPDSRDFIETCGAAELVLRGGDGVGWVTRAGLDAPVGKWAINPVPRRMIVENLAAAGMGREPGRWLVSAAIDNGAQLATRTLNPLLGVEGGLSILGVSGIVIPCSNAAYSATIRVLIRGAAGAGGRAVFVTGGKTHAMARRYFPNIPESAIVRIGDFFKETARYAHEFRLQSAALCCMPGKLVKYAQGAACTHAAVAPQSMAALESILAGNAFAPAALAMIRGCNSAREFFDRLDETARSVAFSILAHRALEHWRAWSPATAVELLLLNADGELELRVAANRDFSAKGQNREKT